MRVAAVLVLLALGAFAALLAIRPRIDAEAIARRVETAMSRATGCEARIGRLSVDVFGTGADLAGLTLTCAGDEIVRVPSAHATIAWSSLPRGRVVIGHVDVTDPVVRLDARRWPFAFRRDAGARKVAFPVVDVTGGDVTLVGMPGDGTLHARGLKATAWRPLLSDAVSVRLDAATADVRMFGRTVDGVTGRGVARLDAQRARLTRLHADVPGLGVVTGKGEVTLPRPDVRASFAGDLDAELDAMGLQLLLLRPERFQAPGTADVTGTALPRLVGMVATTGRATIDARGFAYDGQARSERLVVGDIRVGAAREALPDVELTRLATRVEVARDHADLPDVTARGMGGDLAAHVRWRATPEGSVVDVTGDARDASSDLLPLPAGLRALLEPGLMRVDLEMQAAIPTRDPARMSGGWRAVAHPEPKARRPALVEGGQAVGRFDGGLAIAGGDARVAAAAFAFDGTLAWGGALDVRASVDAPDLAATAAILRSRSPALERLATWAPRGSATWSGDVTGDVRAPRLDGPVQASGFELFGLPLDVVDGRLEVGERRVTLHDATIAGALGDATLDAGIGFDGRDPDGTWRVTRLDLAAATRAFGAADDMAEGTLRGAGAIVADNGRLGADGEVSADALTIKGLALRDVRVSALASTARLVVHDSLARLARGDSARLTGGDSARLTGADIRATGDLPWRDGSGTLTLHGAQVAVPPSAERPLLVATFDAHVVGSVRAPELREADVHATGLALPGLGTTGFDATVRPGADGESLLVEVRSDSLPLTGRATIGVRAPHAITADVRFDELALAPPVPGGRTIDVALGSGSVRVEGALDRLDDLAWEAHASDAQVTSGGITFASTAPLRATGRGRDITLLPARLSVSGQRGGAGDLTVSARASLRDPIAWSADISGSLPARALQPESGLLVAGDMTLDLHVAREGGEITAQGRASLADGYLKPDRFPHAFEDLDAELALDGREARLVRASGTLGGGPVEATGRADLSSREFVLLMKGDDVSLRLPVGARLSTVSSFDLAFAGTPERSQVTGRVALAHAVYRKDVNIESAALRRRRHVESVGSGALESVRLDVLVDGDENLWVDNDLARVEFRTALRIVGTAERPLLEGAAAAFDGGTMRAQGVEYRIVSAYAAFTRSHPNDPGLAVHAETDIDGTRVTLTLSGRLSEPRLDLASDPPLPRERIVAMLLLGAQWDTGDRGRRDDLVSEAARTRLGPFVLPASRAIDVIQIDPLLLDSEGDRTTRLVLGKHVTPKLFAAYSAFLAGTQDDAAELRYQLRPQVVLRLAHESDGTSVIEARYVRVPKRRKRAIEGASAKVASVVVLGDVPPDPGAEEMKKAIGLDEGALVTDRDVRRAAQRARQRLGDADHPLARVGCVEVTTSVPDVMDIRCTVDAGPRVALELSGIEGSDAARVRRAVREAWNEVAHAEDLEPEAVAAADEALAARGHLDARAVATMSSAPNGMTLRLAVQPGARARVEAVELAGTTELSSREARDLVAPPPILGRKPWLTPELVSDGRDAIASTLFSRGYLGVEVDEPRVALDGERATLTYPVRTGARSSVRSLAITGDHDAVSEERVRELYAVTPGETVAPEKLDAATRALLDELDSAGHPDATAAWHVESAEPSVDVEVVVDEGPAQRVGAVKVEGLKRTSEPFVRNVVGVHAGDPLRRADLLDAHARLAELALFDSVSVGLAPAGADPAVRDVLVRLTERDRTQLSAGLGISDEGPRASLQVTRTNIDGRGGSLGLVLRSGREERAELVSSWKRLGGSSMDLLGTLGRRTDQRRSFTAQRAGVSLELTREMSPRSTLRARYKLERIALRNVEVRPAQVGLEDGVLGSVGFSYTRDTRDDALDPQRGTFTSADLAVFGTWLGSDARFVKILAHHARYLRLSDRVAYAGALRLGLGSPVGATSQIPLSERFFAGGLTTVRGYTRDKLGPTDAEGDPTGGEALFVMNNEIRYRVTRRISALGFVDAGNVFENVDGLRTLREPDGPGLRLTAGPGVSIATPAGPIRVYVGVPLNAPDGADGSPRLHFTFGPSF